MESKELRALRAMAWERAKGELMSMIHTYYGCNLKDTKFDCFKILYDKFVHEVESNGLQE